MSEGQEQEASVPAAAPVPITSTDAPESAILGGVRPMPKTKGQRRAERARERAREMVAAVDGAWEMSRGADGLTEGMRISLPIMAAARTPAEGFKQCEELGLVDEGLFRKGWMRDEVYVRALNAERDRVRGESRERVLQAVQVHDESIATRIVQIAIGQKWEGGPKITAANMLEAGKMALQILGWQVGGSVNVNQQVNVNDARAMGRPIPRTHEEIVALLDQSQRRLSSLRELVAPDARPLRIEAEGVTDRAGGNGGPTGD